MEAYSISSEQFKAVLSVGLEYSQDFAETAVEENLRSLDCTSHQFSYFASILDNWFYVRFKDHQCK